MEGITLDVLLVLIFMRIVTGFKTHKLKKELKKAKISQSKFVASTEALAVKNKDAINKLKAKRKNWRIASIVLDIVIVIMVLFIGLMTFLIIRNMVNGMTAVAAYITTMNKKEGEEGEEEKDPYEWWFAPGEDVDDEEDHSGIGDSDPNPGPSPNPDWNLNDEVADPVLRNYQYLYKMTVDALRTMNGNVPGLGNRNYADLVAPYYIAGCATRETSLFLDRHLKNPQFDIRKDIMTGTVPCNPNGSSCPKGLSVAQHYSSGSNFRDGIFICRDKNSYGGGHAFGFLQQEEPYWKGRVSVFGSTATGVTQSMDSSYGFIRPNIFFVPDAMQTAINTTSFAGNSSSSSLTMGGQTGTQYFPTLVAKIEAVSNTTSKQFLYTLVFDQIHNSGSLYGSSADIIGQMADLMAGGARIEDFAPQNVVYDANSQIIATSSGSKQAVMNQMKNMGVQFQSNGIDAGLYIVHKVAIDAGAYYQYQDMCARIASAPKAGGSSGGGGGGGNRPDDGEEITPTPTPGPSPSGYAQQVETAVRAASIEIDSGNPQVGGMKYKQYFNQYLGGGAQPDYPWCAMFVSYCCSVGGVYDAYSAKGVAPSMSVRSIANSMRNAGCGYHTPARDGYIPKRGDIVIYHNYGAYCHIGIVESCDGTNYVTLEGNCSNALGRRTRSIHEGYLDVIDWNIQ